MDDKQTAPQAEDSEFLEEFRVRVRNQQTMAMMENLAFTPAENNHETTPPTLSYKGEDTRVKDIVSKKDKHIEQFAMWAVKAEQRRLKRKDKEYDVSMSYGLRDSELEKVVHHRFSSW